MLHLKLDVIFMNVLTIDIGGTGVNVLETGQTETRLFSSGPTSMPEAILFGV